MASDEQTLPRPSERLMDVAPLRPDGPRRSSSSSRLPSFSIAFFWWIVNNVDHQSAARQHRLRLRLPSEPRRLRDPVSRSSRTAPMTTYGRAFVVGLLNTIYVADPRHHLRDHPRLRRRHRAAVAQLDHPHRSRPSTSSSSATSRCCCSCCSGTRRCSRVLPGPRQSLRSSGRVFLSNRGLIITKPYVEPGAGAVAIAFVVAIVACDRARRWAKRASAGDGPAFPACHATCRSS